MYGRVMKGYLEKVHAEEVTGKGKKDEIRKQDKALPRMFLVKTMEARDASTWTF